MQVQLEVNYIKLTEQRTFEILNYLLNLIFTHLLLFISQINTIIYRTRSVGVLGDFILIYYFDHFE